MRHPPGEAVRLGARRAASSAVSQEASLRPLCVAWDALSPFYAFFLYRSLGEVEVPTN